MHQSKVSIFRYYSLSWSGCLECKNIKFLIVKKYVLNKINIKVKIAAQELLIFKKKERVFLWFDVLMIDFFSFHVCLLFLFFFFFPFWICSGKQTKQMVDTKLLVWTSNLVLFPFSCDYFHWQLRMFGCPGPLYSKPLIRSDYWIAL